MNPCPAYTQLLHTYMDQLNKNYSSVEKNLLQHQPDLEKDSFYTIATWVWLLQKQLRLQSGKLAEIDAKPYLNYIENNWSKPQPRIWMDGADDDVYLSNLSMAYAALLETRNNRKYTAVQKTMTAIRDFVFDRLLSGGTVLNGVNERGIATDQLLSVMPYGLFSPEDLVMVEAVGHMRRQLDNGTGLMPMSGTPSTSKAATALLALYFLEKSDREKAVYYATLARDIEGDDEFGEVILKLFDHYAKERDEKDRIIHEPLGNENVYISKLTERHPHHPTLEDNLNLTCQVVAESDVASVHMSIESDGWQLEEQLQLTMKDDTRVYHCRLEPLPHHGRYTYHFIARLADESELVSEDFHVTTLEKHQAKQLRLFSKQEDSLVLMFGEGEKRHGLSFSINENGLSMSIQQNMLLATDSYRHEKYAMIEAGNHRLEVDLEKPSIHLYENENLILSTHPLFAPIEWKTDVDGNVSDFTIHWHSPGTEQFYGFGERYNATEQRGEVIDCYVYNQYRDQGTRTYIPIPFYMTNAGYGCFIDTNTYTKFDLAAELNDKCSVTFEQGTAVTNTDLHFYFGDYKGQLASYTKDTGKPVMVPAWALGPWMSSNNWDRQSIVEQEVEKTNELDIPATVIVLEQWSDEATYYMFNDAEYDMKEPGYVHRYEDMTFPEWGRWPDPRKMVEDLHENNLKLIMWQIPIQKYLNKQEHPLKDQDEAYMIEKGYVVKNEDGTPYRIPENWFTNSLIMDFSHEEGREWWFEKRQYLIDIGVDGFKTDGGEFVFGKNLQFANGQTGSEMRNKYPNDYIEAYYDFAQQNDGITFSRAGYTGAQNFPAHWAGDERSTFGAFKRSLIAGINAGLAGVVFWGWDLAGFNGDIPTAELFMRSSSMAAFCPIMQYHAESKAEFNQDRTPWNIAARTGKDAVIDVYRFFANVRMNLMPYLYQEARKASETGLPMMRALMLDYPEDPRARGLYDEYLFGEYLLVAPIIEEGAVSRNVYLPEGKWVDLWTDEVHQGPTVIRPVAKVDQIPVFVKMNRALLLNVDTTKQLGSSVGNDLTKYHTPLCKIYCENSFTQTLVDHLGNNIELNVEVTEHEVSVTISTSIENLQVEVISHIETIKINQSS
ncbi:glycoside hydrolase family 31 protein [Thalassobacillus hwangdonensis]|uniref:TIM-barrel domain-containing protein n=1 Tax=Thalassobacillus hwangdonensis TaxID=546108 RepID=A0ABW3L2J0_9BACI